MARRRVALVSDDLMFASQLAAALRPGGGEVIGARGGAVPESDAVFIDLNRNSEERLELIASLRGQRPQAIIVAFCHHGEKQLRETAMQLGASQCITNGALPAVALRLVAGGAKGRDGGE